MKPEKKESPTLYGDFEEYSFGGADGYNQAYDDFNEWLPSEEELMEIVNKWHITHYEVGLRKGSIEYEMFRGIAKAIHKRLGG